MPVFSYKTIKTSSEGKFKEKGSTFHAFAFPVETEQEIKQHITALKKKFFDAAHHCFAYVLGFEKDRVRAFDDNEPNYSAGTPILGQIKAKDLTNVLIVVVRYFGGVKLGVGGLMAAYKTAAQQALDQSEIEDRDVMVDIAIQYRYEDTPEIMQLVKDFHLRIISQHYETECNMEVKLKLRDQEKFQEKVKILRVMKVLIETTTK